jgi:hypothetical protein
MVHFSRENFFLKSIIPRDTPKISPEMLGNRERTNNG